MAWIYLDLTFYRILEQNIWKILRKGNIKANARHVEFLYKDYELFKNRKWGVEEWSLEHNRPWSCWQREETEYKKIWLGLQNTASLPGRVRFYRCLDNYHQNWRCKNVLVWFGRGSLMKRWINIWEYQTLIVVKL